MASSTPFCTDDDLLSDVVPAADYVSRPSTLTSLMLSGSWRSGCSFCCDLRVQCPYIGNMHETPLSAVEFFGRLLQHFVKTTDMRVMTDRSQWIACSIGCGIVRTQPS